MNMPELIKFLVFIIWWYNDEKIKAGTMHTKNKKKTNYFSQKFA